MDSFRYLCLSDFLVHVTAAAGFLSYAREASLGDRPLLSAFAKVTDAF